MGELADEPDEIFSVEYVRAGTNLCKTEFPPSYWTHRERREHRVFKELLQMVPGLEERLLQSSEEEARLVADLVRQHILVLTPSQSSQLGQDPKRCFECKIG